MHLTLPRSSPEGTCLLWKKMLLWKTALQGGTGSVFLASRHSGFSDEEGSETLSARQQPQLGGRQGVMTDSSTILTLADAEPEMRKTP